MTDASAPGLLESVQWLRRWKEGLGAFGGLSIFFLLLGVAFVLLEIQSPTFVLWDGIKVQGYTQGGLVYYSYHGQQYNIDNPDSSFRDQRKVPTTVYLSRSNPTDLSQAMIDDSLDRWLDFGLSAVWFVLAGGSLATAIVRRRVRRSTSAKRKDEWGGGLPDELVQRLLNERRQAST